MRAQDVGSQLTRVEQADGAWSLPAARLAADPHEWCLRYEREVARAEAAEARADEWRQAEIVARSQVCSLKALFEANRNKLIEARQETEAIRCTAKDALSLQAEVQRLTKLLASDPCGTATALHDGVVAVGDLRSRLRVSCARRCGDPAPPGHAQDAVQGQRAVAQVVGYRRSARRRWRRRWPIGRYCRSRCTAALSNRPAAFDAPPRPAARGARPWAQAAAGVGFERLEVHSPQPRRACVAAAARRM